MTSQIGRTPEFDFGSTQYDSFATALNHAGSDQFVVHQADQEGSPHALVSANGTLKKAKQLPPAQRVSLIHKLFLAIVTYEKQVELNFKSKFDAIKTFTNSIRTKIQELINARLKEINDYKTAAEPIKRFRTSYNEAVTPKTDKETLPETIEEQFATIPQDIHTLKPDEQCTKLSRFDELTGNTTVLVCPIKKSQPKSEKLKTLPRKLITDLYSSSLQAISVTEQALTEKDLEWLLEELHLRSIYLSNNNCKEIPQKKLRHFRCNGGRSGEFDGNPLSEKALETLQAEANATEDNGKKLPPIRLVYQKEGV